MSPHSSRSGDSDEISVAIRALRQADLRLEELTAGEMDTVSDHEVRAFLLQRARNQLRDTEAAKQAAIFYTLPPYITGLDVARRVLSVNESGSKSTTGNPRLGRAYIVGNSNIKKCDLPRGMACSDAERPVFGPR